MTKQKEFHKICLLLLLITILVKRCQGQEDKKLIFVQQLFRHGARYPIYPSHFDNTSYTFDEKSFGELTTQGKNMHYQLGKLIYKAYWKTLFANTPYENQYNQSKFYIKSTDVNRTIESCQSHLMGIFQNLPELSLNSDQLPYSKPLWFDVPQQIDGTVFPQAKHYHPLPIHVEKPGSNYYDSGDFLRAYSPQNCPKQDQWVFKNQNNANLQYIFSNSNFTEAINALGSQMNEALSFKDIGKYTDNFLCSLYLGRKTVPAFTNPKYSRALYYIYVLDLYINLFYTDIQRRTTSSGFFSHTIKNIKRAINNKDVQWVIYSAHDTTVGNMLAAMNMTNAECVYQAFIRNDDNYQNDTCITQYPGYTASIIFEVYENKQTSEHTFKIRYKGQYRKIPFCDYKEECEVSKLEEWYHDKIQINSFAANCGLNNEEKDQYLALAFIEMGIIIFMLIGWIVHTLKAAQKESYKQSNPNKHNETHKQSLMSQKINQ